MKTRILLRQLAVAALFVAALLNTQAQLLDPQSDFTSDEVIIQFNTAADARQLADAVQRGMLTVKKHLPAHGLPAGNSGLVLLQTRLPVAQALGALQNHPAVAYAQPNFIYRHQSVANDINYTRGKLWGMYGDATTPANPFGSQAGEAWALGNIGSSEVYVGVIDEGIDLSHPDLTENMGANPGEIPGNGIDDDGNGYVDDVSGWDFFHGDNTIYDGGDKDRCKDDHGTHISGTIGGKGGNSIGVAGVCWNVKLLSAKFLGPNGGTTADAVAAVEYFTALKLAGVNIVALNNSWGGGGYDALLHATIIRAAKAGILFVAAAGNNASAFVLYPARYSTLADAKLSDGTIIEPAADYESVIAVAAIDSKGALASFSNYSSTLVDVGAPGVSIMSTVPGGRYASWNGTSMATPHVTGGCALYLSSHPAAWPWEIRDAILGSSVPTPSLTGKTITGGRLNVSGF